MFTALLTMAQSSISQPSKDLSNNTHFGIKGGLNFTNIYDNATQSKIKTSGNVGLFAIIPLSEKLSFQPEIIYTSKGAKIKYKNTLDGSGSYRFSFYYLETPLLLALKLNSFFSLNAGGYMGFLTSANMLMIGDDCVIKARKNLKAKDFNNVDGGIVAGFTFNIQKVILGARYDLGLRSIGYSSDDVPGITSKAKNNTASLFIGVRF